MRIIYLLSLTGLFWLNSASSLLAQPTSSPVNQGASSERAPRTVGGGTRTGEEARSCAVQKSATTDAESLGLTALIPQDQVILTNAERVNLYVYIPPETNKSAVLELLNVGGQTIFEQEFELAGNANAIARLVLPETLQLSVYAPYEWRLSIYCNPTDEASIAVNGWINRLEQAEDAVASNHWHENLEIWLSQRQANPTAWQEGLAAEGLADYADREVQTYIFVPTTPLESQTSP